MFIKSMESLCIWSENYRELADWYRDVLELEVVSELILPEDTGVTFKVGSSPVLFWIGAHDGVKGKNQDKYRFMPGFDVDSVGKVYTKLIDRGVKFILKPTISPTKDYYVATALDLDENVIQFFSKNP
jgi:hypothetical protein